MATNTQEYLSYHRFGSSFSQARFKHSIVYEGVRYYGPINKDDLIPKTRYSRRKLRSLDTDEIITLIW